MKKFLVFILFLPIYSYAQDRSAEKTFLRKVMNDLCAEDMYGRGYVNDGRLKAASYIRYNFKRMELRPLGDEYVQSYTFPVNAFPSEMHLSVNGRKLRPGIDYLVDAASTSCKTGNKKVIRVDLSQIKDSAAWNAVKAGMTNKNCIYLLQHIDSLVKHVPIRTYVLGKELPEGNYLVPQHGKLTWTVATYQAKNTVMIVEDTVLPAHINKASMTVEATFIPESPNENIIGMIPGQIHDSFIVFSAHYDHLGMMGKEAMFPGASDNASGTAMLLYLAHFFSHAPIRYTIVFIAFSGEEAGLLGSEYFVQHPLIPLDRIRFLINLDIMGDASGGITVVNATTFTKEFELLEKINETHHFIEAVKPRGKAANSDHYHFTQEGVPSFFIYTNGGKGYYHDVFDKADNATLNHVDGFAHLMIDFARELQ